VEILKKKSKILRVIYKHCGGISRYGKRSLIKEEPDQEHEHDELAIIDLFKESSYQIEQNPNSAHQ
jgi:hypothetical protein